MEQFQGGKWNLLSLQRLKAEKKKQEIIQSAISIIAEKGFHATTTEEIAANLLMTKGSLYYYFKDKQDLLFQSQVMILEKSITNINEVIVQQLPIEEKFKKAMIVHVEYVISERSVFGMGIRPEQHFQEEQLTMIVKLRNNYSKLFDRMIKEGIAANTFKNVETIIVRNIILGAMNWVVTWYSPSGNKSSNKLAETIAHYLLEILLRADK